jgi:hypothetical protein
MSGSSRLLSTPKVLDRTPAARSRVTNGKDLFLSNVDQRSAIYRRFRDVLYQILGGSEHLSEAQRQLARRCALLSAECEKLEADSVAGKPIDLGLYGVLTDRLGRAFQRLGLKRVLKDVTPPTTLGTLLRQDGSDQ